jgi:hypothetical protein
MKTARLPCGCRYEVGDRERWIELCPEHKAETDATRARWAAEHRATMQAEHPDYRPRVEARPLAVEICDRCLGPKPVDQSCLCFDNGCQ